MLAPPLQATQRLATIRAGLDDLVESSGALIAAYEATEGAVASGFEATAELSANVRKRTEEMTRKRRLEQEEEYAKVEAILKNDLNENTGAWAKTWSVLDKSLKRLEKATPRK